MSQRKERITKKLNGINADWVSGTDKYIDPNDGHGARPTYHINPDNNNLHLDRIKRFRSLEDIEDYIAETETKTVNIGDLAHCNKCDKRFKTETQMTRGGFYGERVTRLNEPCTCPHCDHTDWHWIAASAIMPKLEGNYEQIRTARNKWLREN